MSTLASLPFLGTPPVPSAPPGRRSSASPLSRCPVKAATSNGPVVARRRSWHDASVACHAAREPSYDLGSYDPEMDGYVPPEVSLASVTRGSKIGEGSFGAVFNGTIEGGEGIEGGSNTRRSVILKEYKKNVRGRDWFSFYADERAICRKLAGCPGVAPFVGVAGSDAYLVWENIGEATLASVMEDGAKTPGAASALAAAAALTRMPETVSEDGVFASLARALCEAALAVHGEGVVHRDVKPDNVLLTSPAAGSPGGCVVLIDLGGAADFDTGQGCSGEAIFDPVYGAPEQFVREKKAGLIGGFGGMFGGKEAGLSSTGTPPSEVRKESSRLRMDGVLALSHRTTRAATHA